MYLLLAAALLQDQDAEETFKRIEAQIRNAKGLRVKFESVSNLSGGS